MVQVLIRPGPSAPSAAQPVPVAATSATARRFPRKTVLCKGNKITLYSIAWLANICGRTQRSIHKLEKAGTFPTPVFDLKDGYRWYTAAEINAYPKLFKSAGLRRGRQGAGERPAVWLKRNAHTFKLRLVEMYNLRAGTLPAVLADEDALLASFQAQKTIKFTKEELEKMIQP